MYVPPKMEHAIAMVPWNMDIGERTQVGASLLEVLAVIMVYLGILCRFRQSIAYANQVVYAYYYFYDLIICIFDRNIFMCF